MTARIHTPELSKKEAYKLFLKSPFWKSLAERCKSQAKFRCQQCGFRARELHAHHLQYPEDWYKTMLADLVCLCHRCHCAAHGRASKPGHHRLPSGGKKAIHRTKQQKVDHRAKNIDKIKKLNLRPEIAGNLIRLACSDPERALRRARREKRNMFVRRKGITRQEFLASITAKKTASPSDSSVAPPIVADTGITHVF